MISPSIKFLTSENSDRIADGCYVLGVAVSSSPEIFARLEASSQFRIDDAEPGVWVYGTLCGLTFNASAETVEIYLDGRAPHDPDYLDGSAYNRSADPEAYWPAFIPAVRAVLNLAAGV